jgi:recombination protein RecA
MAGNVAREAGSSTTREVSKERTKALELAVQQIERQFGKGAIMKLGSDSARVQIEAIPTGSLALDAALGIGGIPRVRVIEVYGPESSGKTTLALSVIAQAQRAGGNAVFIDAEHALDASYAKRLGVDIDALHVSQPDTGEEALEIAEHLVRSGAVDVIVIDSVAALVPKAEIEGEMGDSHMGLQARLMSQALRKLTGTISKSRTTVIFINQIRMQIGVMFGNPETTTGGRALKFYASIRLDIRRIGSIKDGENVIGNHVKVKVVKNKVAAPFKEAEFDILYNEGISREGEVLDLAIERNLVQKSGTWFSYGEERIGQGRENARLWLREHPDAFAELSVKLREALGLTRAAAEADGDEPRVAAASPSGSPGSGERRVRI